MVYATTRVREHCNVLYVECVADILISRMLWNITFEVAAGSSHGLYVVGYNSMFSLFSS